MGNKESHTTEIRSPRYEELSSLFEALAETSEKGQIVKHATFKRLFNCEKDEHFSDQLFSHLLKDRQVDDTNVETHGQLGRQDFIQGLESILQRGDTSSERNKFYFSLMCKNKESADIEDLVRIFCVAHCLTMTVTGAVYQETEQEKKENSIPYSLAKAVIAGHAAKVSCAHFCDWTASNCPRLMDGAHTWLIKVALHRGKSQKRSIKCCPTVPRLFFPYESDKSLLMTQGTLWLLSTVLPQCFLSLPKTTTQSNTRGEAASDEEKELPQKSEWNLLYDSCEHGQSLNRFKHHCFSYRGSSVMLLQLDSGITLVVCVDVEWREAVSCWGNADCRLLQITPTFKILKAGANMMFFNERSRGLPSGVIVGQTNRPIVSLDTDLSTAKLFYQEPNQQVFSVIKVEVWGCGGMEAKEKQKQQQRWERRQAEKLQKVKLPGKWDENPDKALLEMAGMTTSHAQR